MGVCVSGGYVTEGLYCGGVRSGCVTEGLYIVGV